MRHKSQSNDEHVSLFQRIADRVSYAMGTPANIILWLLAVGIWIALGPYLAHHNFLPSWFTSTGFNFPLNTVTTIAELYIGFLVGASSNRSERNLEHTLDRLGQMEDTILDRLDCDTEGGLETILKAIRDKKSGVS